MFVSKATRMSQSVQDMHAVDQCLAAQKEDDGQRKRGRAVGYQPMSTADTILITRHGYDHLTP